MALRFGELLINTEISLPYLPHLRWCYEISFHLRFIVVGATATFYFAPVSSVAALTGSFLPFPTTILSATTSKLAVTRTSVTSRKLRRPVVIPRPNKLVTSFRVKTDYVAPSLRVSSDVSWRRMQNDEQTFH